jgi:choline dehydrogenase-like flavoprotein
VAPVKGLEGFNRSSPVTGPTYVDATIGGKRLRRGARLWTVATSTFKAETYRFLRQERPTAEEIAAGASFPAGTVHLPTWADGEWLKQLTAEQLVTVKTRRGFTKLEWQKLRERNEALVARMKQVLRRAGYPVVLSRAFDRRTPSHQCGTARMGQDPASSVVNTDLRSHDHDNLYVVDASVLPTSAAVNPALTVAALALRAAAHIRARHFA